MFIFPMAGASRRFSEAGYTAPKYRLPVGESCVFDQVLGGFARYFESDTFVFVTLAAHDAEAFVAERCAALGVPQARRVVVALDTPTAGQAETVAEGLRQGGLDAQQPLTIFNIDTFRPDFAFPTAFSLTDTDGYLEVVRAAGDHWSFAKPADPESPDYRVAEVAEKVRISPLCSTGLYHFRAASLFLDAYDRSCTCDASALQGGERYVAPLYNDLIQRGLDIRYHEIAPQEVIFCGTPAEYDAVRAADAAPQPVG